MKNWKIWLTDNRLAFRICFIVMILYGVLLSFLIPTWQTPDESNHIKLIAAEIKNPQMAEELMEDLKLDRDRIRFQYDEKLDVAEWKAAMSDAPDYERAECMPKGIAFTILRHLPATLGIELGIILGLPTFWVLQLGEAFSLLFYVAICALAIKLMPVRKEVLFLFMVFPMALQQGASINYDAVLLPLIFLYIAYIFYMRHEKESLGWKEVICTLLLLGLITYIKMPYVFLGLLVFLLPKEKISLKIGKIEVNGAVILKWRWPVGAVLLVLLLIGMYALRNVFWLQLITGMLAETKRSAYLFWATARQEWRFLLNSGVGQFGWLDSALPFYFAVFSYVVVLFFAITDGRKEMCYPLKKTGKAYIWLVFFVLSIFIVLSMVNHTITVTLFGKETAELAYNVREAVYKIPYIGGLQGRYFLPFLPLPFLALPSFKKELKGKVWLVIGYMMLAMILTVVTIWKRYWVG